ncbi:MAG: hypothetical protein JO227_18300 [Acetobacteraceae bacterium]|nr:hypothetical protein [Acetobacteraceae bacterium]
MSNTPRPANRDELLNALAFALRFDGRKRVRHADEMMARITAERLVAHLESSGFLLMKGDPARAPSVISAPPNRR